LPAASSRSISLGRYYHRLSGGWGVYTIAMSVELLSCIPRSHHAITLILSKDKAAFTDDVRPLWG
jgi:hypothetical protein